MHSGDREQVRSYLKRKQLLYGDDLTLGSPVRQALEQPLTAQPVSAENPGELDAFRQAIDQCQKCALGATRTKFVFGVGNPDANLIFVGEAPGANEDRLGEPFVGRAGKLLDKMLAAIELTRDDVYILNVLKCRPPGNRNPQPSEIAECEPYLQEQLRIIAPKIIVALGRVAANTLLGVADSLKDMRSQIYTYSNIETRVTYHPAALLRNPRLKAAAWEDFQMIRDRHLELSGLPAIGKTGVAGAA